MNPKARDENSLPSASSDSAAPVAIILAAGQGARFGGDKLLATLPSGERVIESVINHVEAIFDRFVCMIRPDDFQLQRYLSTRNTPWVSVEYAAMGMSQSIVSGIELFPKASGWLFVLGDMPYVKSTTLQALQNVINCESGSDVIAIPQCANKAGNPVGFSQSFKSELQQLGGDSGARSIVKRHPQSQVMVEVDDSGIFLDIDTPDDLSKLATSH